MAHQGLVAQRVQALENMINKWAVPVRHVKVRKYLHLRGGGWQKNSEKGGDSNILGLYAYSKECGILVLYFWC